MRIISKYVLKEHVGPLVFALSALTSLLLLNYVAKQFDKLVGKGLGWEVIAEFFLLSIPFTVAMTLPMAVLVSTLYAFSRLAAENEITALKASGVSMARVMTPVLIGATFLAGLMIWFNDQILPRSNHRLSVLQQDIARKKPTFALRERVFNEVAPGRFYLQANHVDQSSGTMREITIHDMTNPAASRTIHADSGMMAMSKGQIDLILTLYDGYLQEIPKREPGQFQRHFFQEDRIRVRGVGNQLTRSDGGGFKGDREMSICEMQAAVNVAYSEQATTRQELENILVLQARAALTGVEEDPSNVRRVDATLRGLGQAYCTALGRLPSGGGEMVEADRPEEIPGVPRAPLGRPRMEPADETEVEADDVDVDAPISVELPREDGQVMPRVTSARTVLPPSVGTQNFRRVPAPREDPDEVDAEERAPVRSANRADTTRRNATVPVVDRDRRVYLTPASMVAGRIEALRSQMEISAQTVQRYDVEIQKKFALAVACVVFVLLGAPVALRFPRGGVGMTLGVSLVVFAIYYVGLIGGEALADRGLLTPFWAMWAANVIFTAVGLVLLARMGREGATSRGGDFGEMRDAVRSWIAHQGRRLGLPLERRRRAA